jgi:hypothetical protein
MHNESRADLPVPTPEEEAPVARFLLVKVDPDTDEALDTRNVKVPNPDEDGARYKINEAMEAARPLSDGLWCVISIGDDYAPAAWFTVETRQNFTRKFND